MIIPNFWTQILHASSKLFCFSSCTQYWLDYCLLQNLFVFCFYLLNLIRWFYVPGGIYTHATVMFTIVHGLGNCITSSWFLLINIVFALAFVLKCCVYCIALSLITLLSPMCMIHMLICTWLNSSPIACPPSSVLCKWLLCRLYDLILICFCKICYSVEMSWNYFIHACKWSPLFLTLGYTACFSNFLFASGTFYMMSPIFYIFLHFWVSHWVVPHSWRWPAQNIQSVII